MRINIYSGGRRIAVIIALLWAAGCIAYTVFAEPRAWIYFRVVAATNPYLASKCSGDDLTEWESKSTPKGDVYVTVCFALAEVAHGRRLLPIEQVGDNNVRMVDRYSQEVLAYKKATMEHLVLTPEALKRADEERWSSRLENIKGATQFLFGGLAFLWALTAALGWIVRGFMGVQRGRDARDPTKEKTSAGEV